MINVLRPIRALLFGALTVTVNVVESVTSDKGSSNASSTFLPHVSLSY